MQVASQTRSSLVKLAPDLSDMELEKMAEVILECGVDGVVL